MFVKLYLGPLIWNGLSDDVKLSNNVNTLKGKKELLGVITRKGSRYLCIIG